MQVTRTVLTTSEYAAATGYCRDYVGRLLRQGKIPGAYKPIGGKNTAWRIPLTAIPQQANQSVLQKPATAKQLRKRAAEAVERVKKLRQSQKQISSPRGA